MRLLTRVRLIREAQWPVVLGSMSGIVVAALAAGAPSGPALLVATVATGLAATLGWPRVGNAVIVRLIAAHRARLDAALDEGDEAALQRCNDELDEYGRAFVRDATWSHYLRASRLAHDERWSEACDAVAAVDLTKVPPSSRANLENLAAWSLAHAGRTGEALGRARTAVAHAAAHDRSFLLGTLGTALFLDGQHAEAIAALREAIAMGGPRWAQATRNYYLGNAFAALGRHDEAHAAWTAAVTIAPKSRYGVRAKTRITTGPPGAYR